MRHTTEQQAIIKQKTAMIFGDDAHVYLFGSRADDDTKGGDIDLFITLPEKTDNPVLKTLQLNGALQQRLGMQKIDIIFHAPPYDWQPIHIQSKEPAITISK